MREEIIKFIITFIIGSFFTLLFSKIQNKTLKIIYSVWTNRIGLATDDPIFGSVRVLWQNNPVRNLYLSTITIENATDRDCENFEVKLYTENKTTLLTEHSIILDTPYILEWSSSFKKKLEIPEGGDVAPSQLNIYNHQREFFIKVLNRGQKIQISLLSTRPDDDITPEIFISTQTKGIEIKRVNKPYIILYEIFGVPINVALFRGLIILFIISIALGLFLKNIWVAVIMAAICGSISNLLGALEYKFEKFVFNLISR